MLSSLRGRNITLLAGMLLLGQLLTLVLVATLVILPQASRIASIIARNVEMVSATLDTMTPTQRATYIDHVNAGGALRIRSGAAAPPDNNSLPTVLERRVLSQLASELGQEGTMIWRGGGTSPLWVRLELGHGGIYWVSVSPSNGWSPTAAILASFAGALVLSLIAGLLLQRRINRPLTALAEAMDAMPDTRPVDHLANNGPAEIAAIARSFESMAARLAAQEAERSFMLAAISHDLKTPIAKLRLAAALHETGQPEDDRLITRQFERIERMLDQFLDFGRGIDAEQPRKVSITMAVRDAVKALGLDEGCVTGSPGATLHLRPVAFERVITNLVRNAMMHGAPPVMVSVAERDGHIDISVIDSGPGIASERAVEMLKPFTRGNHARPSDGGVGLGLAIAQRFAHDEGGTLTISNLAGGGFQANLRLRKPRS